MRVAVLGVTGFLGAWTARSLIHAGHEVIGVARPGSSRWRIDAVRALEMRTAEILAWPDLIEEARPDVVVSLDWEGVSARDRGVNDMQQRNLTRLRASIRASIRAGARRFVGVGSQAEYGPTPGVIDETTSPRPVTEYGKAKLEACRESAQLTLDAGIEWAWPRVFSSYGPLDRDATVLATIADQTDRGERVELSSGLQPWSYLSAADTARALTLIATSESPAGVINVAHPVAPPLRDSLIDFASALGGNAVELLDFRMEYSDATQPLIADVSRLTALGWRPENSTSSALSDTAHWLRRVPVQDEFTQVALPFRPA